MKMNWVGMGLYCLFSGGEGQQREYLRSNPWIDVETAVSVGRSVFTSENERLDPFPALRNVCFGIETLTRDEASLTRWQWEIVPQE